MNDIKKSTFHQRLSIIAAIGENRELGKKNDLIWRISDDLKRVKELTTGHPIIMGQNTYKSIGRPLPNRINIVLTQDKTYAPEGCVMAHSLHDALQSAHDTGSDEAFIFGGAYVYVQTINLVDRLYLTQIHATDKAADAFFPDFNHFKTEIFREDHDEHDPPYSFVILEK